MDPVLQQRHSHAQRGNPADEQAGEVKIYVVHDITDVLIMKQTEQ